MEMEDKESTDSGSAGLNSESDSPPFSGEEAYGGEAAASTAVVGGGGGAVLPEVINAAVNMGIVQNAGMNVSVAPPVAAVGGGGVLGVMGGGGIMGGGEMQGKKKRGRPRKYDAEGNLRPGYVASPPSNAAAAAAQQQQQGFTLSTPPSYEYSSGPKRGRGKHSGGSGNWQVLASLGELFASTAGGDFTPHVLTVNIGEDVAGKILTFAQKGARGVCVLSANGSVSNVTIRQPGSSGGLLTYEGRFEILTLTGSYMISENGGMKSRTGGLSVSLASPDGRVIGGCVAGLLMAANPIQIVVGSFVPNGGNNVKVQKRKYEHRTAPAVQYAPATVTAAIPLSQAPPEVHNYQIPSSQVLLPNQAEGDNSLSNKDHPNSASTDTSDWNGSAQRPSPDINISVSVEEH